ncbi:MAG: hypothetical protein IMY77_03700 [Chloroflexi bacterium]|nr:hypothetical protein [Chloroflexota bacterium]
MSKFIDKLNGALRTGLQTMGFRPGQPSLPGPRILLVASLAQASVSNLADRVAGADAGLVHIPRLKADTKTLQKYSQAVPDIPWGGWLRGIRGREISLEGISGDFVVFPADTPLGILERAKAGRKDAEVSTKNNKVGRILEVEASLSEGLLRTIDELPVDAVLITGKQEGDYQLTWQQLMFFQHFADLVTKPLLVQVPSKVTAVELQILWQAGVDGVIVAVGAGEPVGRLRELRETIDKLTFPSQRRRGKVKALLPYISSGETDIEIETETEEE